ncbi:MAG TPA: hypothetical protein EYQ83_15860 [Acidobacteria bacterium]|nr:hypothetical protein [Acidobacteriota bacterium]
MVVGGRGVLVLGPRRHRGLRRFDHRRLLRNGRRIRPLGGCPLRPTAGDLRRRTAGDGERRYRGQHGDPVPPVGSIPGVERLQRDVLSLAGVTHLVLFLGTNDLRRDATAEQVIAGLEEIVGRAKARGLSVIGATIIPRNPEPRGFPANLGFGAARNAERHTINEWIRSNDDLDGVLDFDEVLQDAVNVDLINPVYDCDGIHPNVLGYAALGRAIELAAFDLTP